MKLMQQRVCSMIFVLQALLFVVVLKNISFMTVFPDIIYNFAGNKNPITMKTSKLLQNKCLVALMYICLFSPLCCMGQETSERIVDGVIETFTEYGTYDYTTKEAKDACDRLLSTSETMDYNVIFPGGTRRMRTTLSCRNCRGYIQSEILRRGNIKEPILKLVLGTAV